MAGEGDVTAHQATTTLRPATGTAAASAFPIIVTFALGQRHCIVVVRAIRVPAKAKANILIGSMLVAFAAGLFQGRMQSLANESQPTASAGRYRAGFKVYLIRLGQLLAGDGARPTRVPSF